jgi:hypothetical protein
MHHFDNKIGVLRRKNDFIFRLMFKIMVCYLGPTTVPVKLFEFS